MREKLKIDRYYTLYKWIVLGCIALMIPILCAVINFFINRSLIERKVNEVNSFMLKNIQYNIDSKLNNILDISKYYLLNQDFILYALNIKDEQRFLARVREGHQSMKLTSAANAGSEIMMYIREKEYILGSGTANQIEYIYESLNSQGKLQISLDMWKEQLTQKDKSGFLISDTMGYVNCGKENLVYTTPMLYSSRENAGYLIVSIPAEFINILMSQQTISNTILILDKDSHLIAQYGEKLDLSGVPLDMTSGRETVSFEIQDEKYAGACIDSQVTDWKYVVCTPKSLLEEEIVFNRNINLLIVLIGAVIGLFVVVLFQKRNYRSVQKLMDILPERVENEESLSEFAIVERNLRRLYEENQSMQDSIERSWEYDRELCLLAAIKGRDNYFRKLSNEELLGETYQNWDFAFVTIQISPEESISLSNRAIDHKLMRFLIDNIMKDILGSDYHYVKTVDDGRMVYLFALDEPGVRNWDLISMDKFTWLNEFFQKRLEIDLSITLGREFDTFEHVESAYAGIEEVNDQRYYTQPYGVIREEEVGKVDFSSSGSLAYYCKRFEEVAMMADYEAGRVLSDELFGELEEVGKTYNTGLYYVLSIVNNILMTSRSVTKGEVVREEALGKVLGEMRKAESFSTLKDEYYHFLSLICRTADMDHKDSKQLSENIKVYVKEHYADCNMNISAIAEEIGITPRYMSKIFKEQTGITLLNYINDVRIEHAKMLLKTSGKTVDEISEETGFANSRTFRRNFQKATGITAINYKNM